MRLLGGACTFEYNRERRIGIFENLSEVCPPIDESLQERNDGLVFVRVCVGIEDGEVEV